MKVLSEARMKKSALLIGIAAIIMLFAACHQTIPSVTFGEGSSAAGTPAASEASPATRPDGSAVFTRFRSDISDIHVDQTVRVTFFAAVSPDSAVSGPVTAESGSGDILGELKDDWIAPDESAHDGIYTGAFDLSSPVRKNETYRAVCQSRIGS